MNTGFINEEWKTLPPEPGCTSKREIVVSAFGRVKSITKTTGQENFINGSLHKEGYRVIHLKWFKTKDAAVQKKHDAARRKITTLQKQTEVSEQQLAAEQPETNREKLIAGAEENKALLQQLVKQYDRAAKADLKKRTINKGWLVHRMVAALFCPQPTPAHTIVIHLDYNKQNNQSKNLRWATPEESIAHQQNSPAVIAEKKTRTSRRPENNRAYKLTITRVMLIKKRLKENIPLAKLAKQFKVTETQIARIKKGENWKNVPAAS